MRRQVALAGEDVKKHAVQFVGATRGVITDDDPLQFGEFRLDLVVVPAEYVDRITLGMLPPEQPFDIGENLLFLVVHVLVHFGDVLVEEPQDGESHVVMTAIDRLDQLAADGRKPEIEKIDMRIAQVAGERSHRDRLRVGSLVVGVHVDDSQESSRINPAVEADLADGLVTETQCVTEAAHDKQHGIAVANQVAHAVVGIVSPYSIHNMFYICKNNELPHTAQYLISGICPGISGFRCRHRLSEASCGRYPAGRARSR